MDPVLQSFVGGAWRDGVERVPDVNPARPREIVAEAHLADARLAAEAVEAAAKAFGPWRSTPPPARGEVLRRAADLLEARAEQVGRDLTREEGKTLAEGVGETRRAAGILRYYAGQTLEPDGDTYPSHSAGTLLFARREPVGVVSMITPWNFPIAIPAWKMAPALACGNTVVWKPAGITPLTAVHLLRALIEAGLPAGVLNLILGRPAEVGEVLITHPDVAAVTFTGSNAVGQEIRSKAVAKGKRLQLELGGKNPAVVLADALLDHAAEQVARGAFLSAGQKCTATSRVIVERSVLKELQDRLVAHAEGWKLGDPLDPDTKVGPLASDERLQIVMGYLQSGMAEGGQVVAGGRRATELGDGYYVRPTVFTDVRPDSRIAREEIFGPVAVVVPVASYEEGVAVANDTPFGLAASLFTTDLSKALRFASDMRAGVVKINQETAGLEFYVPFGGMKESSWGPRELGKGARDFFTQWKTVCVAMPPPH